MPTEPVPAHRDDRPRCSWATSTPEYIRYHDEEWGTELHGDDALFERLTLAAFQSGLSWITILRKRENFRASFAGFSIDAVAAFTATDEERLMADAEAHNSRRLDAMVFPAQIDTVTPELFAAGRKHADESGRRFSTHIGQSVVEVREMIRRHNMTPIQWAAAQGLLKNDTGLAHCILLDDHPHMVDVVSDAAFAIGGGACGE